MVTEGKSAAGRLLRDLVERLRDLRHAIHSYKNLIKPQGFLDANGERDPIRSLASLFSDENVALERRFGRDLEAKFADLEVYAPLGMVAARLAPEDVAPGLLACLRRVRRHRGEFAQFSREFAALYAHWTGCARAGVLPDAKWVEGAHARCLQFAALIASGASEPVPDPDGARPAMSRRDCGPENDPLLELLDAALVPLRVATVVKSVANTWVSRLRDTDMTVEVGQITLVPLVPGNPEPLRRVLSDVLANAVTAIRRRQTMMGPDSLPGNIVLSVTADATRGLTLIKIADNGVGLSPDQVARLNQTGCLDGPATGSGKGFPTGLAALHQYPKGGMSIASDGIGRGATVTITLAYM